MFKPKKGAIQQLQALIIPLVAIAIVLVVGFLIMAEIRTQIVEINATTNTELALNATDDVVSAISDIPGWLPIIVITIIGAALIGLVAMFRSK